MFINARRATRATRFISPVSRRGALALGLGISLVNGGATARAQKQATSPTSVTVSPLFGAASEMRQSDARLEKRVTVLHPGATLATVLTDLSKQSGVTIALKRGAVVALSDDAPVCMLLRDAPLHKAMDALTSLMSFRRASWTWIREKEADGAFRYELRPSTNLTTLADDVRRQARTMFEAQDNDLREALQATPAARLRAAKRNPYVEFMTNADGSLMPREKGGLGAFFELPKETRQRILRGEAYTANLSDLSAPAQTAFNALYREITGSSDAAPERVTFFTQQALDDIAPEMLIACGNAGAYNYIGGAGDYWRDKAADLWSAGGADDAAKAAVAKTENEKRLSVRLQAPAKPAPYPAEEAAGLSSAADDLARRYWQIAQNTPVSIVALLPAPPPGNTTTQIIVAHPAPPPVNKTLRLALQDLSELPFRVRAKWSGDILLLRNPNLTFAAPKPIITRRERRSAEAVTLPPSPR